MKHKFTIELARKRLSKISEADKIITGDTYSKIEGYVDLLSLQCEILRELLGDPEFKSALDEYTGLYMKDDVFNEVTGIFVDIHNFIDYLEIEEKILQDAGLSREMSSIIVARQYRDRLRVLDSPEQFLDKKNIESLFYVLEELRDEICDTSKNLNDEVVRLEEMRNADKRENLWLSIVTAPANIALSGSTLSCSLASLLFASWWAYKSK